MQCNCGGSSEHEHKVVRDKKLVATYEKCPACGRIKVISGQEFIDSLKSEENEQSNS